MKGNYGNGNGFNGYYCVIIGLLGVCGEYVGVNRDNEEEHGRYCIVMLTIDMFIVGGSS